MFVEKLAEMVKGLALIDNELRLADSDIDVDDPDMLNQMIGAVCIELFHFRRTSEWRNP